MSTGGGGGGTYAGGVYGEFQLDMGDLEKHLQAARAEMKSASEDMGRLEQSFRVGAVGADRLDAEMDDLIEKKRMLAAYIADLEQKLRAEAAAMGQVAVQSHQVDTGMKKVHEGSSRAALGLLAVGQAVDDAQYGFRGIANNLPQIAMMFGAGAGVGGAVAIAATGINQLVQHWDELNSVLELSPVRTAVERMHDLAAATAEATAAQDKLNEAKAQEQRIAALAKARTPEQEATERAARGVIEGAGTEQMTGLEAIRKGLAEARIAQGRANPGDQGDQFSGMRIAKETIGDVLKAGFKSAMGEGGLGDVAEAIDPRTRAAKELKNIRGDFDAGFLQSLDREIDDALRDPTGRKLKALAAEIRRNANAIPGAMKIARQLEELTPEGKLAKVQPEDEKSMMMAALKDRADVRKRDEDAAKKQTEAERMMRNAALKDQEDVRKRDEAAEKKRVAKEAAADKKMEEEAPKQAKASVFGIEKLAGVQMERDVLSGKSFGEAAARAGNEIEAMLKALGWDPDRAQLAGIGIAEEERKKLAGRAEEALLNPKERKSELFSAESAWAKVQGSIGGKEDVGQKQLEQQMLAAAALRELVAQQQKIANRQPVAVLR